MIQAIALLIITISLLILAYRRPRLGFSMLGVLMLGVLVSYLLTKDKVAVSDSRFQISDVAINNPVVIDGYAGTKLLRAEISNQHTVLPVNQIHLQSTRYECEGEETSIADCLELERNTTLVKIFILPEKAKTISVSLPTGKAKPVHSRWLHEVLSVR